MVRWPWTRGPVERLAPAVPAAAPPAVAPDPAPSPMGWAFLPPLQRTLDTPIAPITRPTSFPGELPAWRSPVFTSTLSHAVVDTMPGGIVDGDGGGLGAPTHAVGPAPELTLLPPPRPTALQRSAAVPTSTEAHVAPVARAGEHREAGESDVVRPDVPVPVLTRAPALGMPVVQRSVVAEAPPLPAAEQPAEHPVATPAVDLAGRPPLGSTTSALPSLQRSAVPNEVGRPAVVQRGAADPLAVPAPATPRLGLGPPLQKAPATALITPPEPYDEGPAPIGPAPEPPVAPAPPPTAAVTAAANGFTEVPIQRALAVTAPPTPRPALAGPQVQPPADLPAAELTLARSVVPDAAEQPASPPVGDPAAPAGEDGATDGSPGVPQVRDAVDLPDADHAPEQVALPDAAAAVAPPALLPSAPLPLASGIATSIQRADLLPGPGSPTPSLVVRPASLIPQKAARERVVPIQRLAVGEMMAPPTPAANGPAQGRAAVQRAAPPYALAPDTPPSAPPSAPALPEPPVPGVTQPDVALGAPPTIGPEAIAPDAVRQAAVPPLSGPSPVVSRSVAPDHPVRPAPVVPTALSRSAPPLAAALPLAAAPTETVAVQAAAEASTPAAEAGPATSAGATLPEAGGGGAASGPDPVSVQTATAPPPTPGGAAPGAAAGASATGDVDALAQRLFPAVLRRIKAELLLDRERRGVRTDPW